MHTEEKSTPSSLLLRLGGTITGVALSAFAAAILYFILTVLNVLPNEITFTHFLAPIALLGAGVGMARPRQTFHSLWFFFPEILDR